MSARNLIIGLDGADLDLVRALGSRRLPALHALLERGVCAALRSVQPPATLPNWTTFLTGADPGAHGVFDFTVRSGYRVRFSAGCVRELATFMSRLDALGLSCLCAGFPGTWPPEQLGNGVFISGWDAPVAFEADRSFVWPPELYGELKREHGALRFDDVDEFAAGHEAWHERLPAALVRRVRRKTELGLWLLERRSWDVFAFYFGESDTASHHLWSLHDPESPRRPSHVNARQRDGLARVYEALDEAVAELARAAGPDTEVTVVSDHGSGGSSDKVLYLNCVLEQAGLLRMHRSATAGLARGLKETALTQLPPRLRERVYRFAGARLPGLLESSSRFGAIDMARTTVFSDELNYFPALHFNLRGREPNGTLHPGDAPRVRRDVEQLLAGLRDPWTGRPVVAWVKSREQLYRGPYLSRAPDLLLGFELDGGYSYNMMPSAGAPAGTGPFRRLAPSEYLGRKGRSLPGSHRPHGLLIMAGPQVQARGQLDAEMADATASVLARLGIAPLEQGSGRVLPFGSPERAATHRRLPGAPVQRSARQGDEARVEARLRALGYLE